MARTLRIGGVPEHFNLPWRLAIEDGAFARSGLGVDWQEVPAGTGELTRALREDELDLALVLTEGAIADVLKHNSNRLVKVWVASPLTWGIHVASNSHIRNIKAIERRRIAISRYGSGSHLIPIVDAAQRGWSTQTMSFVVIDNLEGARHGLKTGKVDVFFWEKHMTQPLVDSGEFRRVGAREVPWPAFVVSGRRDVLKSHGAQVRATLDVAARYARNLRRRSSAIDLISRTYGIGKRDVASWLNSVRWSSGYRRPTGALQRAANALMNQGVVPKKPFDPSQVWLDI